MVEGEEQLGSSQSPQEGSQIPVERVDPNPSIVAPQPETQSHQSALGRLRAFVRGLMSDIGSRKAQRLNTHATPPLETSSQQPDSPQVREPGTS